ncbi:mammalian cell entry protein [Mycolicibacterium celeriflavum]|uniref:MCE family protein n=2 Tax=Mycolicibacterium TaxID=1866885 RepID=A0AAW5ST15_MYCNV|nr:MULTISPECIES: MCE family protein [Mycobacteriaceae]MCV7026959.1 MCE family protein [Mycolicibacterium novocastrense]MCV7238171.1 MCE family protein [Mycolicibacterium celeriflavum]OBG12592.1 mammalian cell entry protein [Mycolicibacterium celeriflavum]OBG97755.1 mammalian cell entry protein [Mycobacterium sp. E136]ORA51137.1 mammalian cell entry protein [Mycolicibacterium celeriflavum]
MRTLEGSNRVRGGLMGIIILIIVIGVGQSFASVPMLFASPTYYAYFSDTGGIGTGDKVRIAGVDVGDVRSMEIEGDKVKIGFGLGGTQIGTDSRAAIRTDTILGRRTMEIEPRGSEPLRANGVLPLGQTTTPYQIYDAFFDVTKAASDWDTQTVKRSLNVLSETIDQTYPHLSAALDGVARFSDTIGKRDEDIKKLLSNANKIAGILGSRSEQINQLLVNAQTLLGAINERQYAVSMLLERVGSFSEQVKGLIDDNPNLNRVLEQLRVVSGVLVDRKYDLMDTLTTVASFVASLGEAVASGPYFKVMLVNLLPGQILQPFVDAAFKKRGIDPQKFWRDAGLPAWRFPDPNAQGFENGAPPPGPAVLEGTPENPGPGVLKGSPCSYTPPADGLPTPGDPLPCADLSVGPFGGPAYGPPNVATSDPNVHGPQPSPGVPAAAIPGQISPPVPGADMPLPPAPPGARTVPVGPQPPLPPDFTPGIAPLPPALPAPAVPGPGQQLPPANTPPLPGNPPFLPPLSQGQGG